MLAVNKPWRPIPSGRITIASARRLQWIIRPACIGLSAYYNVKGTSLVFILLAWAYNECGMHSAWPLKQLCNAGGYATLELGATLIFGKHLSYLMTTLPIVPSQPRRQGWTAHQSVRL